MVEGPAMSTAGLTVFSPERFVDALEIGAGRNATIFRAYDARLGRDVVFKVSRSSVALDRLGTDRLDELGIAEGLEALISELEADASHPYTLHREGQMLASIDHPNVLPVLDIGVLDDGALAVILPLLEGSLAERDLTDAPWEDVLDLAMQIGRGLEALHEKRILHRDFKPNNILLDDEGRPRIADLGFACSLDDEAAMADWTGTPAYMSPETLQQRARDVRDDLFAYCVVVYEMFYGHAPFANAMAQINGRVLRAKRRHELPRGLRRALLRGLAADPEQRWPDMTSLLEEFEQTRQDRRRWPRMVTAGALSVIVGLLASERVVEADACTEVEDELAYLWNEAIEHEMRGALGSTSDAKALGDWARRWLAIRASECETAKRLDQELEPSPCMVSARERFRLTLDALRRPELRTGLKLNDVINSLPAPEQCLDRADDGVRDPGSLFELRELSLSLDVLTTLGDLEAAKEAQQRYMDLARAHSSKYHVAWAIYWRGELHRLSGELEAAERDLELALEDAGSLGALDLIAEVSLGLAVVAGERGHVRELNANARIARATMAHVDPDRLPEVLMVQGAGLLEGDESDQEQGLFVLREALTLREEQFERYAESPGLVIEAHEELARGLFTLGRYEEAIEATRAGLGLLDDEANTNSHQGDELMRWLFASQIGAADYEDARQTRDHLVRMPSTEREYAHAIWTINIARTLGATSLADEWDVALVRYNLGTVHDRE